MRMRRVRGVCASRRMEGRASADFTIYFVVQGGFGGRSPLVECGRRIEVREGTWRVGRREATR